MSRIELSSFDIYLVKSWEILTMERYTLEQRILIVKIYYQNGENFTVSLRKIRAAFPRNQAPSETAVRNLIAKFEAHGTVADNRPKQYARSGRSDANIAAVQQSVENEPGTSTRRRSQQLGITRGTLRNILHKDLHLHAYKVQLVQELKPADHCLRRTFVNWLFEKLNENNAFFNKIIFSDEAHFQLGGYVNKQNCRIWGSQNPQTVLEKPLYPKKVTVWCGLWSGGIIGPYFFENEQGNAVTVNSLRYQTMINDFLWPQLANVDISDLWFQQDGATSHTVGQTIQLLHEKFPGRVISRFGDVNWPPRSCDLTPLDYFLWGHLKDRVYVNKPQTTDALKDEIRRCIDEISEALLQNVVQNFVKRADVCRRARGGHLPDIIFHY